MTAALGDIIVPVVRQALPEAVIEVATDDAQIRLKCEQRLRFDVVMTDLIWQNAAHEYNFDGLDVIAILRHLRRTAPVLVAIHGQGRESDHLDEALEQPEVAGVVKKASGPRAVVEALSIAIHGQTLPESKFAVMRGPKPSIYEYFEAGRRGATIGRIAGAIAAGRATDASSLAATTHIPLNTVNKLVDYLGPLILGRGEHDPSLNLTGAAVYRWVGIHAHYILSWCRRNGHADIAVPYMATAFSSGHP